MSKYTRDMCRRITGLSKEDQIQILSFFHSKGVKINENKSGCFINVSALSPDVLDEFESLFFEIVDEPPPMRLNRKKK